MCGIISGLCFLMHALNLKAILQVFSTQSDFDQLSAFINPTQLGEKNGCTKDSNDDSCRKAVHLVHSASCCNDTVKVAMAFLHPVIVFYTI